MDPVFLAILQSWDFRPEVLLLVFLAAVLFTRGFRRLHRTRQNPIAERRLAAYWGGLAILLLALISPIDALAEQLFAMHMVQHVLLVMIAPVLLLLANPFPYILWGLPKSMRSAVGRWLRPEAALRSALRTLTRPNWAWFAFVVVYLGWHDPNAYNAALQYGWVHDLEHLTFFFAAVLFWWQVIPAAPRLRRPLLPGLQIAFLAAIIPVNMLTGIAFSFAQAPIYSYYVGVHRLWGLSVLQDQMLAGTIMWIPGSMMYLIAMLVIVARIFTVKDNPPAAALMLGEQK